MIPPFGMGLWDSLVGNEVKMFLKRKDSDAGEAGLKNLNAHYSQLHHKYIYFIYILYFFCDRFCLLTKGLAECRVQWHLSIHTTDTP